MQLRGNIRRESDVAWIFKLFKATAITVIVEKAWATQVFHQLQELLSLFFHKTL